MSHPEWTRTIDRGIQMTEAPMTPDLAALIAAVERAADRALLEKFPPFTDAALLREAAARLSDAEPDALERLRSERDALRDAYEAATGKPYWVGERS